MYLEYHNDGHFEAATGTLQLEDTEGVVEYQSCMWVEDTKDGGASEWIAAIDGKPPKRWAQQAGESREVPPFVYEGAADQMRPTEKPVYAHCHCRGVEFWIIPPNSVSTTAQSDYPDLMVPYNSGSDASANPSNVAWWLRDGGTRFLAGTCACHSCRRSSGFHITFWAFVPTANIYLDAGLKQGYPEYGADHQNDYWGTMKAYNSSEGVMRTFCGRCGATIFWDGGAKKGRDGLIDIAVGLLDAESGAKAEELLKWWTSRVSFEEFAMNKSLIKALGEGLEDWERRRQG